MSFDFDEFLQSDDPTFDNFLTTYECRKFGNKGLNTNEIFSCPKSDQTFLMKQGIDPEKTPDVDPINNPGAKQVFDSIVREYCLGLKINELNCDSFMKTLGCIKILEDGRIEVVSVLDPQQAENEYRLNPESYRILLEYIPNTVSFESIIDSLSATTLLSILAQILLILMKFPNFKHNDLHEGNILLLSKPFVYTSNFFTIKSPYTVRLIDFARAELQFYDIQKNENALNDHILIKRILTRVSRRFTRDLNSVYPTESTIQNGFNPDIDKLFQVLVFLNSDSTNFEDRTSGGKRRNTKKNVGNKKLKFKL
jgi:hypothetical protein